MQIPNIIQHEEGQSNEMYCLFALDWYAFLEAPLTPDRWPKIISTWCHDSNVPSFVINRQKNVRAKKIDLAKNSVFAAEL